MSERESTKNYISSSENEQKISSKKRTYILRRLFGDVIDFMHQPDSGMRSESENTFSKLYSLTEDKAVIKLTDSGDSLPVGLIQPLKILGNLYPNMHAVTVDSNLSDEDINQIGTSLSGLLFTRKTLEKIDEKTRKQLLNNVENDLSIRLPKSDAVILRELYDPNYSYPGFSDGQRREFDMGSLTKIIKNIGFPYLLNHLLAERALYTRQLGVLLGCYPGEHFPESVKKAVNPRQPGWDYNIKYFDREHYLCDLAEPRLQQSLEDDNFLIIGEKDPLLLTKFVGILSALCLQDFETKKGKYFVKGNWYSPRDTYLRSMLEREYLHYKGRVDIEQGDWELMKPIKKYDKVSAQSLLDASIRKALNTPLTHSPASLKNARTLPIKLVI